MNAEWRQKNNISSFTGTEIVVRQQALPELTKELFELFDVHELEKYMTSTEVSKGGSN